MRFATATPSMFLPERNGIRLNTLRVLFDVVTVTILVDLAVLTAQVGLTELLISQITDKWPPNTPLHYRSEKQVVSEWSASLTLGLLPRARHSINVRGTFSPASSYFLSTAAFSAKGAVRD